MEDKHKQIKHHSSATTLYYAQNHLFSHSTKWEEKEILQDCHIERWNQVRRYDFNNRLLPGVCVFFTDDDPTLMGNGGDSRTGSVRPR